MRYITQYILSKHMGTQQQNNKNNVECAIIYYNLKKYSTKLLKKKEMII